MEQDRKVAQIGWDSHRKFSQVAVRNDEGRIVERRRVEHANREEMRKTLRSWPAGTPVVLEASFGWSWISDELREAKLDPHLASSRKLAAWREARGLAKSNRLDAELLSELMSERERWWEVWLAPQEVRDQRELLRFRMALVETQTKFKNRIHAILHRYGILHEFSDLFGCDGRRFLQRLANGKNAPPRESGRVTLKGYLHLLDHVRQQIAQMTRLFRKRVQTSPTARRLRTLPGISWILAYTLEAEIGNIGRFKSSKNLASYSLLAPRANDSGDDDGSKPIGRHVGFCGRRTLKWAFIEAARSAVMKDARLREFFNRRTDNGKHDRNRGYICVARHLAVSAYVVWKKEQDYNPTPPARPGTRPRVQTPKSTSSVKPKSTSSVKKRQRATSRPGTGQPEAARVPVAAAP
jgi:transposase